MGLNLLLMGALPGVRCASPGLVSIRPSGTRRCPRNALLLGYSPFVPPGRGAVRGMRFSWAIFLSSLRDEALSEECAFPGLSSVRASGGKSRGWAKSCELAPGHNAMGNMRWTEFFRCLLNAYI